MTGVRYDAAWAATESSTMGITLSKNTTSGASIHTEAPGTRSAQAAAVYNMIHPRHSFSVDDPDRPRKKDVQLAMFRYLSSDTMRTVVNSVIGFLGRLNIALCIKSFTDVDASIQLPPSILIIAAVFVSSPYI